MFCGPTGLSVPHTIAPPDPEIGSAAERGCASTDEAKLWVEGPLGKKSRQRSRRMLHARRCNGAREDGFAARPLVRVVVRHPGRATRDQRLGSVGRSGRPSGQDDAALGATHSTVRRRSQKQPARPAAIRSEGEERNKNPPRVGPGRLRGAFVRTKTPHPRRTTTQ